MARAQVGVAHEGEQRWQCDLDDPGGVCPRQGSEAAGSQLAHVAVPVAQLRRRGAAVATHKLAPPPIRLPFPHLDVQEGVEQGVAVLREAGDDRRDDGVRVRPVAEREVVRGLRWVVRGTQGPVGRRGRGGGMRGHAR